MSPALSDEPLHIRSPLVHSATLSTRSGCNVYLKLDNAQPSGSFKMRGIGHLATLSRSKYGDATHLITSSGGNAGLACAHAAQALRVRCTVFVPVTTKDHVVKRLREMEAEVLIGGAHWAEADKEARKQVESEESAIYVPPFDHPALHEGHSTIVDEISEQLVDLGVRPLDAIVCSVGGGGLISGILSKISPDVVVVACETHGAASFAASLRASCLASPRSVQLQTLPGITSIASTLGAVQVCRKSVELALAHGAGVVSVAMDDAETVRSSRAFLDDHQHLVEPACSVSLAPFYRPSIIRAALASSPASSGLQMGVEPPSPDAPVVVVVVCGGSTTTLDNLLAFEEDFKGTEPSSVAIFRSKDGESVVLKD